MKKKSRIMERNQPSHGSFSNLYKLFTIMALFFFLGVSVGTLVGSFSEVGRAESSGERVIVLKGTVVTMNPSRDVLVDGCVIVEGEKIVEVLSSTDIIPTKYNTEETKTIETNGFIYPGILNIHSHPFYNMLPIWNVPGSYTNRGQWPGESEYKPEVSYPKHLLTGGDYHLAAEVAKYAEVKELVGGGVAIQGIGAENSKYSKILIHNVEMTNYGEDHIYQNVGSVKDFDEDHYKERYNDGRMKAFFMHLCEGIDSKSTNEFQTLKSKGLLNDASVVIHGTGMTSNDFQDLANANGHLVWSPLSNLLLYGKTADVVTAHKKGVEISLGPDWSPSGSKNVLNELKYADMMNRYEYDSYFSYQDLVEMVNINPARACAWEDKCGSIQEGLYAEIMVVHNQTATDPYKTLVQATEKDIELVLVQGDPLYGDVSLMAELKGSDMEIIESEQGFQKAIDVTKDGVNFGDQRLSEIEEILEDAMQFDKEDLDEQYDVMHPIELDPIFTCDDDYFFVSIRNARNMDVSFDLEKEYYWWRGNLTYADGGSFQSNDFPDEDVLLNITSHSVSPEKPTDATSIRISVSVSANYSIRNVTVVYRLENGPLVSSKMTLKDGNYTLDLGTFPGDNKLVYNITANSVLGNSVQLTNNSVHITKTQASKGDPNNGSSDDLGTDTPGSGGSDTLFWAVIILGALLLGMVVVFSIIMKKRNY